MSETKTITFTQAVQVLDHNKAVEVEFTAGQTIDLPVASANRWLTRGMAVDGKADIPDPDAGPYDSLTVAQLQAELDGRQVEYKAKAKRDELLTLLTESDQTLGAPDA